MKKLIPVIFISTLFSHFAFTIGGNDMGNGGDFVFCQPSPQNDLTGYYSLDFVLTRDNSNFTSVDVDSVEESMESILEGLQKIPHLARSFQKFWQSYKNKSIHTNGIWEPSKLELVNIKDEDILSPVKIPNNCLNPSAPEGTVSLRQAVIRLFKRISGSITNVYVYDSDLIKSIENERPLQISYLLVHEWLWDHSQNVNLNRRLNQFLHSLEFTKMSEAEMLTTFKTLGFDIRVGIIDPLLFHNNICKKPGNNESRLEEKYSHYPAGSVIPLSEVNVFSRSTSCDKKLEQCDSWVYTSWRTVLNNPTLYYLKGLGKLRIASYTGETHAKCDIESDGKINCGFFEFIDKKFKIESLSGYFTESCLQLEGKMEDSRDFKKVDYYDFLILLR